MESEKGRINLSVLFCKQYEEETKFAGRVMLLFTLLGYRGYVLLILGMV